VLDVPRSRRRPSRETRAKRREGNNPLR